MFGGRTSLIRPLLMVPEKELSLMLLSVNLKEHEKSCPYENSTKRNEMENLLKLLEKLNKDAEEPLQING